MELRAAFLISVGHGIDQTIYAEIVADFESAALPVLIEERKPEFFASLQYLVPTALVLYLLKPYTKKFLEKLAEDNYGSCKAGLRKLWSKCLGKDRQLRWITVGTKGKAAETALATEVSFAARTADEQTFCLLLPCEVSADNFVEAIERFYSLMAKHDRTPADSLLSKRPDFQFGGTRQRVLTLAQEPLRIVEVDVLRSAQSRTLVVVEISTSTHSLAE